MVNLNFSSIPERTPLAEGMYILTIKKAEEKMASTGKNMIVVQYQEEETKTTIFNNYILQENCLFRLRELLAAIGFDTTGDFDLDVKELEGQMVRAKVTQEEYQGEIQNRITKVYAC